MDTLKLKKAWEVALAPVKNLPMTAIMMYMSGNSLQIFSIMMVLMAFKNPIMGLLATNQTFERFESAGNRGQMLQVKLVYVAMQLLALGVGLWKVNAMGLLPYAVSRIFDGLCDLLTISQDDEVRLAGLGDAPGAVRTCGFSSMNPCR